MSESIIEVRDLVKRYGALEAVRGVSFRVPEGICFGLLGPNGAGKTTTVEIMEGITRPSRGQVLYRGAPLGARFRERAGIQFQSTALQDFLTVRETLELFRRLYRKPAPLEDVIEMCALVELLGQDNRTLSGGQRQRLLLALALVNDPEVLFLDEPTTGLDPQARRRFWSLVEGIKARGKTILLTTHYMEEANRLCDAVAIMDHGRIIADGAPASLLRDHFDEVILSLPAADLPPGERALPGRSVWHGVDGVAEIATRDVNEVLAWLLQGGASLGRLRMRAPTLEDLFLALTGEELRS